MHIQIHSPIEINEYFHDLIFEKLNKLKTFYDRIERADVYLREGNGKGNERKVAEIRLAVPKNDLFIKVESETFTSAVIEAIDKLKRLVIKHKEKLGKH